MNIFCGLILAGEQCHRVHIRMLTYSPQNCCAKVQPHIRRAFPVCCLLVRIAVIQEVIPLSSDYTIRDMQNEIIPKLNWSWNEPLAVSGSQIKWVSSFWQLDPCWYTWCPASSRTKRYPSCTGKIRGEIHATFENTHLIWLTQIQNNNKKAKPIFFGLCLLETLAYCKRETVIMVDRNTLFCNTP